MSDGPHEQRNPYKGTPARAWIRVRLAALDKSEREFDLLADTGNPFAIILGRALFEELKVAANPDARSNLGLLAGGWLHVRMPELGLDLDVGGYGSDEALDIAKRSSPDFEGLVGLPLLRLLEYGGDGDTFWVRRRLGEL